MEIESREYTPEIRQAMLEGVKFKKCVYVDHPGTRLIPASNFGVRRCEKDGLNYYCRRCVSNYMYVLSRKIAKREGRVIQVSTCPRKHELYSKS